VTEKISYSDILVNSSNHNYSEYALHALSIQQSDVLTTNKFW